MPEVSSRGEAEEVSDVEHGTEGRTDGRFVVGSTEAEVDGGVDLRHGASFPERGWASREGRGEGGRAEDDTSCPGTSPTGDSPVAAITSPESGERLSLPVDVVGTATSDSLASWQLERRLRGQAKQSRFAAGTEPVVADSLGPLDPTLLLNGIHRCA